MQIFLKRHVPGESYWEKRLCDAEDLRPPLYPSIDGDRAPRTELPGGANKSQTRRWSARRY